MAFTRKASLAVMTLGLPMLVVPNAAAQDDFTINLGGRLHVDYANASSDNTDFDVSATALRRARLKGSGQYGDNLKYKLEFTFSEDGSVNIEDGYLAWTPDGSPVSFKAGHFKTQNSLEEAASSLDTAIIERAAFTDAFQLDRRLGSKCLQNLIIIFCNLESSAKTRKSLRIMTEMKAMRLPAAARINSISTAPASRMDSLIHIGGSFRYRDQSGDEIDGGDALRYRQRPFVEQTGRIISTGRIADSDTFYGGEVAGLFGQAWGMAEYTLVNANCVDDSTVCTDDPSFNGWSVGGGYFFGGKRNYAVGKFKRPTIDNPVTKGGWGAVSINARYDTLDLNDEGIQGGDIDTFAVGANWWLHKQARIQLNYFNANANLSGPNVGPSLGLQDVYAAAVTNAALTDDTVDGFIARLQFDF